MKNFKNPKILKTALFLFITAAVFSLIGYAMVNRNKETIIDLGNGWKSYEHKNIGIKVKIPADAEAKYEVKGDKKDNPWSYFSKGPISSMRAWLGLGINADSREQIDRYLEFSGYEKNDEKEWEILKDGNRRRNFYREIVINNKNVLIDFYEFEDIKKETLKFQTESMAVPGKTRVHYVYFNPDNFTVLEKLTQKHPHFTEEEIENFVQKHINQMKEHVISIDNF